MDYSVYHEIDQLRFHTGMPASTLKFEFLNHAKLSQSADIG